MEECEGEVESSGGGIIKPIVRSRIERLRSDIPERTVLDAAGMGRGAEVADGEGAASLLGRVAGVAVAVAVVVVVGAGAGAVTVAVLVAIEFIGVGELEAVVVVVGDGFVGRTKEWPGCVLVLALALASDFGSALELEMKLRAAARILAKNRISRALMMTSLAPARP